MVSIDKRLTVVLFAAATLLVSLQVFASDDAEADTSYIRSVSIKIYDQDSADYSDLAYLSAELPTQFSAAEWVRDADNGLWYNINTVSSEFGMILRYGMVDGITAAEIRQDVGDYRTEFTPSSFVIIQAGCDISGDCGVNIEIKKSGTSVLAVDETASLSVAGAYIPTTVQGIYLYSVGTAAGDIVVADPAGLYSITMKCNGVAAGSASTDYLGTVYHLYGYVKDKSGKPIPDATVTYEITDAEGTPMSEGVLYTDDSGEYIIESVGGTVVNVTGVSAEGFTFPTSTYCYGTITGDVYPGMTFVSSENYIRVIVKDQSARPAAGVEISAVWYRSYPNGDGTYTIEAKTTGVSVPSPTDEDGIAFVTLSEVFSDYNLLVKGMTGQFSFEDVDPIYPTPSSSQPLPDHLEHAGNAYANVTSFVDVGIKADDYSVVVTVSGSIDSSMQGGAALTSVQLAATWYYQKYDGTYYIIRDKDHRDADPMTDNLIPGRSWFSSRYTDDDGNALLHYTRPANMEAGEEAFLYIYATGAPPLSPSGDYVFTYALPRDGAKTVMEIADEYVACAARPAAGVTNTEVYSDDVSYTVSGQITGDLPDSVRVYCITPSGVEMSKIAYPSGGTIDFTFTVRAGASVKIGVDDLPGYVFTPQRQQMSSAYSDTIVFNCVSEESIWSIDRAVPAALQTYTINGLHAGDVLSFKYAVAGTNVTMEKKAEGSVMTVTVNGASGNVVDSFGILGSDLYIKWTSDTEVTVASMKSITVVTFYDTASDDPTIDNVVGGQTVQIFVEGGSYAVVVSDAGGKAVATVPDVADITFRHEGLNVPSVAVTSGAYEGCTGLNLKEVIPSPASKIATLTIRYVATSSLQNEGTPTNVDILSGPVTVTLTVGDTNEFTAPEVEGFTFSGWYINGTSVSDTRDLHICNIRVTEDMDGATLLASYAADTPEPPKEKFGTTIAIGVLAVTIALIAMIYVVLQVRRY